MANKNDQRILEMKKQIENKKEKLGKVSKFLPITNCFIEINGVSCNIQTLNKQKLIELMVKLNSYLMSAKELEIDDKYEMSGFLVSDWIADVKARFDIITRKEEEKALQQMEKKLSEMLSEDKKVELEIDQIESLLRG